MAYVNIHSIPGVTVAVTYWNAATPVPAPVVPLSLAAGVYSLPSPQTEWDRVVFEITSYGLGVLPMLGRISVTNAYVGGPYDGVIGIATGDSYASITAQQIIAPDALYTGSKESTVSDTIRYFICGHNSGSGADWQQLDSLIIELDGTFPEPVFWQDFKGTFEDTTLQKLHAYVVFPEVIGRPAIPATSQCYTNPSTPPGDDPPFGDGGGGEGGWWDGGSGGPRPEEGTVTCVIVNGTQCCFYSSTGQTICS